MSSPMDVESSPETNLSLMNNISSIISVPLLHSIPRQASNNKAEWTVLQDQEYAKRQREETNINRIEAKIGVQLMKLKKLYDDRNAEVHLINTRRQQYDDEKEIKSEMKKTMKMIKTRKIDEAEKKEQFLEQLERGKYKKD